MLADDRCKAWLWQVYQYAKVTSRDGLFTYFWGQNKQAYLTTLIVNKVTSTIKGVFSADNPADSCCSIGPPGGESWVLDKQLCASYLYYLVAEFVLQQMYPQQPPELPAGADTAAKRFKGMMKPATNPNCYQLVDSEDFHLPLVECALTVVACITSKEQDQSYPWVTKMMSRCSYAVLLWQAIRSFQQCFSDDSTYPIPKQLQQYLQHLQCLLLDNPVLSTGSVFYSLCSTGAVTQTGLWKVPLAGEVLQAYNTQAVSRAQVVGWQVQQQPGLSYHQSQFPSNFHEQCAWLMDKICQQHLDLCMDQHMSVVVACVVYVVAKVLHCSITFKRVMQAMTTSIDGTSAETFVNVELHPADCTHAAQALHNGSTSQVDVREFYNTRFLPAIEPCVRLYLDAYNSRKPLQASNTSTVPVAWAPDSTCMEQTAASQEGKRLARIATARKRAPLAALNDKQNNAQPCNSERLLKHAVLATQSSGQHKGRDEDNCMSDSLYTRGALHTLDLSAIASHEGIMHNTTAYGSHGTMQARFMR